MHTWQAWPQKPPELPSASSSVLKYLYGQEVFFLMSHLRAPYCHVNLFLLPILQRAQRTVSFLYLSGSLAYCKTVITSHISFLPSGFKLEVLQLSLTGIIPSPRSPSLPFSAWSPGTPSFLPVLNQNQTQLWEAALTLYRGHQQWESHCVSHRQREFCALLLPIIYSPAFVCAIIPTYV